MASVRTRTDYRITYVVLCVGVAAFALLQSLVNPVLPTIQAELHTDQSTVSWVLTTYLLSASVFTPITGRIGDRVGKNRMLVVTLAGLAAGSFLAAVSTSISVLIVARVIQGLGGGVLPLSFAIIRDEFPKARIPGAVGTISALVSAGGGIGLILAGPIVEVLGYRWLFWIPMVITTVAVVAAAVAVPASPGRSEVSVNPMTALLISGGLVTLLLGVVQGGSWGWASPRVLGLLGIGIVLLVAWVLAESASAHPLIDMNIMRIPTVWTVNVAALFVGMGMYSMFAVLPPLLQTPRSTGYGFGASVTVSGIILLPQTVGSFAGGILAGRLTGKVGSKPLLVVGTCLMTASMLVLGLAHTRLWAVLVGGGLLGVAIGLAFAAMATLVVSAVPLSQTGVASGMNANIRTVGGAMGTAVVTAVLTAGPGSGGLGFTRAFFILAAASAAATLVAILVSVCTDVVDSNGALNRG
ncbi:MFS transporter [Amycolatopsis sp. NBC_01480]|uniref:MFS transporter n=1 Tax=Amycolatopsis sp. NBC_01480 TaxID=2903562 RepID=UPI002E2B66A9|nr:MFS transporter [Amycolatopsis sp. NBC_01480]